MDRYFRGEKFVNRNKDIKFLLKWFEELPKEILWIYGPKSSGKTTLIEYVIENELFKDFKLLKLKKDYWVKYINFRRTLISSYNNFLESFFEELEEGEKDVELETKREYDLWVFRFTGRTLKAIKEKKKNLFHVLLDYLHKIEKKKIIIIDEIQSLKDIYINGERELLEEFLNFCVALTKEMHLSHVVILSSNTIFIDKIYNEAKLKITSEFYKLKHLDKKEVERWLIDEGFKKKEINLIWDYLGGCIPIIQKLLRDYKKEDKSLKEYLERKKYLAYTEILHFLNFSGKIDKSERKKFLDLCEEIVKKVILN